ncbi:hypothetical protein M405DRAFT_878123 [Rhizopogon salebrosus TDB-379]|nr:hypothetical protein M405DRAFT_878123 [Rhizopogon salebrosus TDB-379]
MTFMTVGGVATLYPEFTLYGKNVCSEDTQQFHGRENRIGTSKSDALALKSDTSFLGSPCGRSCPSLWRSFADYGPYGVFNWDARCDVKRVFANCDVEWRVHEICVNHTANGTTTIKIGSLAPSSVVPANEIDIGVQERIISNHQPPYGRLYVGVLFATAARLPILVHIPLKDGVAAFCSLRDLEVGYWVNQRDPNGRISFSPNFTQVVYCTSYRRPAIVHRLL